MFLLYITNIICTHCLCTIPSDCMLLSSQFCHCRTGCSCFVHFFHPDAPVFKVIILSNFNFFRCYVTCHDAWNKKIKQGKNQNNLYIGILIYSLLTFNGYDDHSDRVPGHVSAPDDAAPECWFFHRKIWQNPCGPKACHSKRLDTNQELFPLSAQNPDLLAKSNCGNTRGEWHPCSTSARRSFRW